MKFMNKIMVLTYSVLAIVLLSGCASSNYSGGGFKANSSPSECYDRGHYPYMFADGSIYCYKDKRASNVMSSPEDCYKKQQYPLIYDHNIIMCTSKKERAGDFTKNTYNKYGYDKYGYTKQGYNKQGYNKQGYNRQGYNRSGYTKDGYDRYGFNKKGKNRQGLTRQEAATQNYQRQMIALERQRLKEARKARESAELQQSFDSFNKQLNQMKSKNTIITPLGGGMYNAYTY